jgi:UDP-N-acetylmuramoyl-tripeptide--D-alanyl-D-alanine ligase
MDNGLEAAMPLWTSRGAAEASGGTAIGEWAVSGVSIDSRSLKAGELFVPLKDVRDGHDFIPAARETGAGAVMSETPQDAPALIVGDSLKALTSMGRHRMQKSNALRIGVTGSAGKTSVKEALAHIFKAFGHTHKSLKSYNNHWGVPLTMARMPMATDYGIFELGMNHAGEIEALSKMLEPNIALINNVAGAHLAHFESLEKIADAKAEIIDGLAPGGIVVLNGDNEFTPYIRGLAEARGIAPERIFTFGTDASNTAAIVDVRKHPQVTNIRLRIEGQQIDVTLPLIGDHWVSNVAACMCCALAAKVDLRKAARQLRSLQAAKGRGARHSLTLDGKTFTLIDESYNANPASMRAAIGASAMLEGRKIAVLGDMFELGADELALHAALAAPLESAGYARVITTGECMRALKGALPQKLRGAACADWAGAKAALMEEIETGDIVLIKGSNAAGLGQLVDALIKEGSA